MTRLLLASTSAQRRAILEQLRIPFEAVAPSYVEHDPLDADPVELVRAHAEGKARSVQRADALTLGVDTTAYRSALDLLASGRYPFADLERRVASLDDLEDLVQSMAGESTAPAPVHGVLVP